MLSRLSLLVWVSVLFCAFIAFGGGEAKAEEVLASWYGAELAGSPTASGEPYDPYGYTAAHKTLPLGTELVVAYGGSSVQVTVNDRGPYIPGRELDLSQGAAEAIGLTQAGVDYVDYTYADPAASYAPPVETYDGTSTGYTQPSIQTTPAVDTTTQQVTAQGTGGDAGYGGAYVVQHGQTLSGIAAELGTSVEQLAAANGIANPDLIFSGQTLVY
jgi:rare lipoprotein A